MLRALSQLSQAVEAVCRTTILKRIGSQTADRIIPGIGLHMTLALAENGAKRVYIVGRRLNVLEQVVKDTVSCP